MSDSKPRGHVFMAVNTYAPDDPRVIFSAASLVKLGYQVRLIGAARQRDDVVETRQVIDDVQVQLVPMVSTRNPLRLLAALWRVVRGRSEDPIQATSSTRTDPISFLFYNLWVFRLGLSGRIDIIHAHDLSPLPAGWLLSRLRHTKLIYDAHENVPTMYEGRKGNFIARLEKWLIKKPDVVISAGERLEQALMERGAKRVMHIGNWKRLADYDVPEDQIAAARQRFNLTEEDSVIVYIGTIDPTREITPLLEAVKQSPDVHLIIGGRGLLVDDVIAAAEAYDNIHWLGWVDIHDVPLYTCMADSLYCCLDIARFTEENYYAPAANKLFEGYAAGTPLIARRNVNEMGDILAANDTGILLDDVTPETLKEAFALLRDKAKSKTLRENALKARDKYNWSVAEERLQEIYSELTGAL